MSSNNVQDLFGAVHAYIIYALSVIAIAGFIGNVSNIIIFTNLKKFRKYPGAFYIIAESMFSIGVLYFGLTVQIVEEIFELQLNQISFIWCKTKNVISEWCALMVLFLVKFTVIDQYLSTNHNVELRQWSTVRLAKCLTIVGSAIWLTYTITFTIFYSDKLNFDCFYTNTILVRYYSYNHLLILYGNLSMVIVSVFSILAYRNVRQICRQKMSQTRRHIDQQLTAIILARVILFILILLPNMSQYFYTTYIQISMKESVQVTKDLIITMINLSISYVNMSVCICTFMIMYCLY